MTHDYTPNMLVKLIYGETDLFQTLEIEDAIENNSELKTMFFDLKNGFKKLPKVTFSPSNAAIQNIMFHSALYEVEA